MDTKMTNAQKAEELVSNPTNDYKSTQDLCLMMAEWKDKQTFYVVTRCEEHDDYVERLFVDGQKAKDYCNRFKDNDDEYSRHITGINLTL